MSDESTDQPTVGRETSVQTEQATERTLGVDPVFDALRDRRCRYCCYRLSALEGDEIAVERLAAEVASMESEVDGTDLSVGHYDRVVLTLHHRHLPKLADANVVAYDSETGTVRYRPDTVVDEFVDRIRGEEIPPTRKTP